MHTVFEMYCIALGALSIFTTLEFGTDALTGSNICPDKRGVDTCCYNFVEEDGRCVECPPGYYGHQCNSTCKPGYYGKFCKETCNCEQQMYCDMQDGCKCKEGDTKCEAIEAARRKTTEKNPTLDFTKDSSNNSAPGVEASLSTDNKQDNSHLFLAVIVVSSVATVIIVIVIVFVLYRIKVKKWRKAATTGNTRKTISVMSKIYDEINDDLIQPSCSSNVAGPSGENGKCRYEKVGNVQGKSKKGQTDRGSYIGLDEAAGNVKEYDSLRSRPGLKDYSNMKDSKGKTVDSKGEQGILNDSKQNIFRKKSKGVDRKKINTDTQRVPSDYDVPPSLQENRDVVPDLTDYKSPPPRKDVIAEKTDEKSRTDKMESQQAVSVAILSCEIPPLPNGNTDQMVSENQANEEKSKANKKEKTKTALKILTKNGRHATEETAAEDYDTPPKRNIIESVHRSVKDGK